MNLLAAEPVWWRSRGWVARLLLPLSWVYAALRWGHEKTTQSKHSPSVFTIVVGNLYSGGVGKTPVCLALLQHLKRRQFQPGVVSRGYARQDSGDHLLCEPLSAARSGDEPTLYAKAGFACAVALRRQRAVDLLRGHGVNIVVSDDGLQHYAMPRNLEIVVQDERGVGNGYLLPAGPLRESPRRRRDATLLRIGVGQALPEQLPAGSFWFRDHLLACRNLAQPEQALGLESFRGQEVAALAAIGHPENFFAALRGQGIKVLAHPLRDHSAEVASHVAALAQHHTVLITGKDAIKCTGLVAEPASQRVWVVQHEVEMDPAFWQWLDEQLPTPTLV